MEDNTRPQCIKCGRRFKKKRYWQKFCSQSCSALYHNERRKSAMKLLEEKEAQPVNEDIE